MKSLIIFSLLSLATVNSFANDKLDYSQKIVNTYQAEMPISSIIKEAINKGVFSINDHLLSRDGTENPATLGSTLTQTFLYITDPNFLAINLDNAKGLEFLLGKGLDPNQLTKDHDEYNLLISAATSCNLEAVKVLISHGANPLINVPDKNFPTVSSREANGASEPAFSHFNYITQDLPVELDSCFNTFKYFIEVVGVDIKNHGCGALSWAGIGIPDKSAIRYYNYMNEKFGTDFTSNCAKLDDEQMKKAGF